MFRQRNLQALAPHASFLRGGWRNLNRGRGRLRRSAWRIGTAGPL